MYGVGARGHRGGDHTPTMLQRGLRQVMEQIGSEQLSDLPKHLIA